MARSIIGKIELPDRAICGYCGKVMRLEEMEKYSPLSGRRVSSMIAMAMPWRWRCRDYSACWPEAGFRRPPDREEVIPEAPNAPD